VSGGNRENRESSGTGYLANVRTGQPPRLRNTSFREDDEEESQPLVDTSENQRV